MGSTPNTVRLAVRAELVEAHAPFDRLRVNALKRTALGQLQLHTENRQPITAQTFIHRIALVIFSKLEGTGNSAIYRTLMFAQELQRAGDDVTRVFDGAGGVAAAELAQPGHRMHTLFKSILTNVRGVCSHCAKHYGVLDAVQAVGLPLLGDDNGHASLRALLEEGRQVITV